MRLDYSQYYNQGSMLHRRLGPILTINGKDAFERFDADLIDEPVVVTPEFTKDTYQKIGKHSFWINTAKRGIGGLDMELYVGGNDKDNAQDNYAHLIYELDQGLAIVRWYDQAPVNPQTGADDDEVAIGLYFDSYEGTSAFEYVSTLIGYEVEYTDVYNFYHLTLHLLTVKRKGLIHDVPNANEKAAGKVGIHNTGNATSGMRIIVKTGSAIQSTDVVTLQVSGCEEFHISDLLPGNYYVIDGIEGKVLRGTTPPQHDNWSILGSVTTLPGYVNFFNYTDLIDFPVARPKSSWVYFSGPVEEIACEYYPVYLM